MSARISPRPIPRRRRIFAGAAAAALLAGLAPAVVAIPAEATPADADAPPAPAPTGPTFSPGSDALTLREPSVAGAPGYTISVGTSPFRVTAQRGGHTVLATTAAGSAQAGPVDFKTSAGWATATAVTTQRWHDGVLDLTLATSQAGVTVAYRIAPQPDRYRITWSVDGATATQVATHYDVASAGHWYGQGETSDTGLQFWPLDSAKIRDPAMGPAEYLMTDPFWFTQRGTGLWVDTHDVMDVSMNSVQQGVFGYTLTDSATMDSTVFVERTARDVYADYVGITGVPAKSDATAAQYAKPLWNSWAQFYPNVSQASTLSWAKGLHDAGVPAQAIQVDDGWMSHYGDFTFNNKSPTPRACRTRSTRWATTSASG
jgi:hypothetical protein